MKYYLLAFGKSMRNFHGVSIVGIETEFSSLSIGDIVAFEGNDKKRYAHRIIKINGNFFTTKGDLFSESKHYEIGTPIENIIGKVFWKVPKDE